MRHSRSISDLRADVAENCRALLMLAAVSYTHLTLPTIA